MKPTIAIISPGDMGHAVGALLRQAGLRVITQLDGRSGRTRALFGGISALVWLVTLPFESYGLFNADGFRYKRLLAEIRPGQTLVIGLALGFFLAEQLLHYYCDRCLFRFRDAAVRRKVAPLVLGDPSPGAA